MPVNLPKPCQLRRRSDKQGPWSQPRNRGWAKKLSTERKNKKIKIAKTVLTVGTWNVRTLREAGKMQLLQEEPKRYRCDNDILGISEMRWTKAGEIGGVKILWPEGDSRHEAGVGFLLSNRARNALMGYKPVSNRTFNMTIIQV